MDLLIYVIVLNYCSAADTLECYSSICNSSIGKIRALVIDNDSPDGSGDILKESLPEGVFVQLKKNTGYAGGNNFGITRALQASADYIFIINPDVRLAPGAIDAYIELMDSDPSIAALNPVQLEEDGSTLDHKFFNTIIRGRWGESRCLSDLEIPDVFDVNELLGAAILLPRRTFEKVGGFDPLYFAYSEEVDLCRRIKWHGLRLCVTTRVPAVHLRSKERAGVSDFVLFLRLKGMCLFKIKDPYTSISRGSCRAFKLLWEGIRGVSQDYPFNRYPIRLRHIAKTAIWLVWHLPKARRHRNLERLGRAHV